MSLTARTLLFLSADYFLASSWQGGRLSDAQYFTNDAEGREQFAAFLQKNHAPTHLLVDVIEEDFRHELIPHLIGPARREVLERKLEQYYRNTPFRQHRLISRQPDGRRDDDILFSALTNPARIIPWVETLLANRIPLIGIHSVPNISAPLFKGLKQDHVLLLSWERHAGLRQTYFDAKRLHFSRLTPIGSSSTFSAAVAAEMPRTLQYLKSLSLPAGGEQLHVSIICHHTDREILATRLEKHPDVKYSFLDLEKLAKKHKARIEFRDSDATPLYLHLLATKPPTDHYANSEHTRFYTLWQLNLILYGFAIVFSLGSLLWSVLSLQQGWEHNAETQRLLAQAAHINRQADEVQRRFPPTTVPAGNMKSAVLLLRELERYSPPPETLLIPLSSVLEQMPRVRLNKLGWQTSPTDAAPSPYPAQILTLEAELLDFGTDYRAALAYLERLQQGLTHAGYTVSTQSLPLDISAQGHISNEELPAAGKPLPFTLKLVWRQAA